MRAFWKKKVKKISGLGRNMWFPGKKDKKYSTLTMLCDETTWPTTNQKVSGRKTMSISFIRHLGIWNQPSCWVTVAFWNSWPTSGDGKKWVIRPYPLACPCSCSHIIKPQSPLHFPCKTIPKQPTRLADELTKHHDGYFWEVRRCFRGRCYWSRLGFSVPPNTQPNKILNNIKAKPY